MPTELQLLRRHFLARLADELGGLGFRRRGQDFYRKTEYGKEMIHVTFVSHPGVEFVAELYLGVRHDAVEDLVNEFSPGLPDYLKAWTSTVGERLDNMFRDFLNWKWRIADTAEAEEAARLIMETVHRIALPYFERFSSLEEAFCIMSRDDDEARRLTYRDMAGLHAVAAAYVLGKREEFDRLVEKYTRFLSEASEHNFMLAQRMPEFLAMVDELKRRWDTRG